MSWDLKEFKDKDIVFVGVGQGRSMEGFKSFVSKHGAIKSFSGVDKQEGAEPLAFLKNYDQNNTLFVKNEGIPPQEMPVPYVTPMNVFFACAESMGSVTIGITGTKGKSTTAALTAAMLSAGRHNTVLGGNIGEFGDSLFDNLDSATKDTVFVVELSSYQLSDIEHSPHISAIINLFNDHADWHGSQAEYWQAKRHIIAHSKSNDLLIYNPEFPELRQWAESAACRTQAIDPKEEIDMSKTALYGEHNRLNALTARKIAREMRVNDEVSQEALNAFVPLKHRMELVLEKNGHKYIDDAIGMTPESTTASLLAVSDKYGPIGCLLLGGQDRGYDFSSLLKLVAEHNIPALVLFPDTVEKMRKALPTGYSPKIFETRSMDEAVKWASENAPAGTTILLSTAAPSYSLWTGFPEKGDKFTEAAKRL